MPEVIQQMLDAVGGVFDSPIVQLGLRAIGLYIAAIWLATAYWAFRDMQLRTTNPILPYFAASLIILFTPIFFIFGVLTYRIVRPQEKIGETYERTLAEEALLAEVEEIGQELPDLRPAGRRRVDHLPDLSHPAQSRLPQLQPPRRPRLVAVRLVRARLRADAGRIGGRPRAGPARRRSARGQAGVPAADRAKRGDCRVGGIEPVGQRLGVGRRGGLADALEQRLVGERGPGVGVERRLVLVLGQPATDAVLREAAGWRAAGREPVTGSIGSHRRSIGFIGGRLSDPRGSTPPGGSGDAPAPDDAERTDGPRAMEPVDQDADGAHPVPAEPHRLPPGVAVFSLEGRAAPGLYALGWAGTIGGVALLVVAGAGSSGGAAGAIIALAAAVLLGLGLFTAAGAQGMQRQADARLPYRGPSPFLVFVATLPITVILVALILGPASAAGLDLASSPATLIQLVITAVVNIVLVRLLVVSPGALSWSDMGLRSQPLRDLLGDIGAGALLAIPVIFVTALLANLLVGLLGTQPPSPLPLPTTTTDVIINLIAAAIVAPIGEEVLYRGLATTAWARGMGARRGLVRGALFFAFVHILTISGTSFGDAAAQAFIAFAIRLPVAFALGWVFLNRRSLPASIGLHATFNGLLLLLSQLK